MSMKKLQNLMTTLINARGSKRHEQLSVLSKQEKVVYQQRISEFENLFGDIEKLKIHGSSSDGFTAYEIGSIGGDLL